MNFNFDVIKKDCEILYNNINCTNLRNKKILITGANGLIGSFLADFMNYLNEIGYNIDIYLTSYSEPKNATRIQHLISNPNIKYFAWDSSENIKEDVIKCELDYVFFCSGYGQPSKFTKDNIKTSFINTIGVNSLLNLLSSYNKKTNFLFISTSEIYGDPDIDNIPTKETYNGNYSLLNNRASYIVSKRMGEIICNEYSKNKNINIKIARVGLIYGPGVLRNDQRVLQDFIFKAKENGVINLLDSGNSLRNYLYITDGVEMLLNLALNSKSNETTYNIGGDKEPITIYELAQKIASILNCNVNAGNEKNEIVNNSPKNVYLCMNKYLNEFEKDKNSFILLDNGLKNVIKWYQFI